MAANKFSVRKRKLETTERLKVDGEVPSHNMKHRVSNEKVTSRMNNIYGAADSHTKCNTWNSIQPIFNRSNRKARELMSSKDEREMGGDASFN